MSYQPVKRSTFFRDVEREGNYLFVRSPIAANRFLDAVESTVELLTLQPFLGHQAGFRRALGYRSFPVSGYRNYLIFYKVRGNEIVLPASSTGPETSRPFLEQTQIEKTALIAVHFGRAWFCDGWYSRSPMMPMAPAFFLTVVFPS